MTPRKCPIFGVCCEAVPQQLNYVIDEAADTGKGANAVISMLHNYLENHGIHSAIVHLNADNCAGQNKKNAVMQVHSFNTYQLQFTITIVFGMEGTYWEK